MSALTSDSSMDTDIEQRDSSAWAHYSRQFREERWQVAQVAQREATGRAVDAMVGERQAENVGLRARARAAISGEHSEAEVKRDRQRAGTAQVGAQVASTSREVDHRATGWQCQRLNGPAPPTDVEAEGHNSIDHVVARCDCIEHLANGLFLLGALGRGEVLDPVPTVASLLPASVLRYIAERDLYS